MWGLLIVLLGLRSWCVLSPVNHASDHRWSTYKEKRRLARLPQLGPDLQPLVKEPAAPSVVLLVRRATKLAQWAQEPEASTSGPKTAAKWYGTCHIYIYIYI